MVLPKTPGAAGCAHCQALDATPKGCPICARPICRECAKDPHGCIVPHPRELRLGIGGRLREVDPAGRIGLYTRFGTALHDLDLNQPIARLMAMAGASRWLPLPRDELLVVNVHALNKWIESTVFLRLDRDGKKQRLAEISHSAQREVLLRELRRSEHGRYAMLIKTDESVDVLDTYKRRVHGVLRVAGQVLQAVAASEDAGLIAVASYGQLFVFGLDDCQLRGRRKIPDGDVHWLAAAQGVVGAANEHGELALLRASGTNPRSWTPLDAPPQLGRGLKHPDHACLSPEGRLFATGRGKRVELWSLTGDEAHLVQTLQMHTDNVHFLRFSQDGQLLITGDQDNRVVLWPRNGDRVVTLEDAREGLALR